MSIFEKIKEAIKNVINRKPRLGEGNTKQKAQDESEVIFEIPQSDRSGTSEQFAKDLFYDPKKVSIEGLTEEKITELSRGVSELGGRLGWTHDSKPLSTGNISGKNFAAFNRLNVGKDGRGLTVCLEDGSRYDIIKTTQGEGPSSYREETVEEDGTKRSFSASLGSNESVYNTISRNGVKLSESAFSAVMYGEAYDFEHYAEPSEDLLQEYSDATGLPIILAGDRADKLKKKDNMKIENLTTAMRSENPQEAFPYVVKIEATREATEDTPAKRQLIEYVYSSLEAYKDGEAPKMVYIEGLGGRSGTSGMFRLLNERGKDGEPLYIDNSTFRREKGKFVYDRTTLPKIMELTGKMYPELSEKSKRALISGVSMPEEIETIYNNAYGIKTIEDWIEETLKTQDDGQKTTDEPKDKSEDDGR